MTKHIQLAMLSTDLFICTHLVTLSQLHWCWRCIELSWVISILTTYSKSFMKIENKSEPKQLPCGTPQDILCCLEKNCNQHPTKVELKMIKMFWQMIYLPHILWFLKKALFVFLRDVVQHLTSCFWVISTIWHTAHITENHPENKVLLKHAEEGKTAHVCWEKNG